VLSTVVHKAQAIDQNKQGCIDPYSCFWGKTLSGQTAGGAMR
jgi:hypothetical protein